jgi:uncharacterized membrane protein
LKPVVDAFKPVIDASKPVIDALLRRHSENPRETTTLMVGSTLVAGLLGPMLIPLFATASLPIRVAVGLGVIVALVVGAGSLLAISLLNPAWGLALAGVLLYNPFFNYRFLYSEEFHGGSLRASVSILVIVVLSAALALKRRRQQWTPLQLPLRGRHWLFLFLLALGAASGLFQGHDVRLIASDVFPIFEFAAFYLLALNLLPSAGDARQVLLRFLAWGTFVAAFDLALYALNRDVFLSHFALAGTQTLVQRIDDFMPALLFPVALSLLLLERKRDSQLLYLLSGFVLAGAIALTFFRSLYTGVLAATLVILGLIFAATRTHRKTVLLRLGAFVVVGLLLAGIAGALALRTQAASRNLSIPELVADRIRYVENTSGPARVEDNGRLLDLAFHHPIFGAGLGSKLYNLRWFSQPLPIFSSSDYYLGVAAQLGFPAFLTMIWIAWKFMYGAFRTYRSTALEANRAVSLGVIGAFVSMGITLLTFPALLHFPIAAYLAIMAGMLPRLQAESHSLAEDVTAPDLTAPDPTAPDPTAPDSTSLARAQM